MNNPGSLNKLPVHYQLTHGEHPHARKPWVLILPVAVALLFGIFWLYSMQTRQFEPVEPAPQVAPTVPRAQNTELSAPQAAPAESIDVSDLQAAALNTPIADFSDDF